MTCALISLHAEHKTVDEINKNMDGGFLGNPGHDIDNGTNDADIM